MPLTRMIPFRLRRDNRLLSVVQDAWFTKRRLRRRMWRDAGCGSSADRERFVRQRWWRAVHAAAGFVAVLQTGCVGGPAVDLAGGSELLGVGGTLRDPGLRVVRRGVVFETIASKAGSHAPTLVAFDDGTLLAAWYSYDGPGELDGAAIYMARRPAGQVRWSSPWVHADRPQADANPVLYAEGANVWLFQAVVPAGWSTAHIEFQVSSDRGRTWSQPRVLTDRLGANVRFPPVRLASGELLLPAYDDLLGGALFYASRDGLRWQLRSGLRAGLGGPNIQPSLALLDDGTLLVVMRDRARRGLWASRSTDAGRSWSTPARSGFDNPDSPTALSRLRDGRLLMVFNDSRDRRTPLSLSVSDDGGRRWSPPMVIVQGPGAWSYPSVAQTPDAVVHVLYSHDRRRIGYLELAPGAVAAQRRR